MRKFTAKGDATKNVVFPGIAAWLARNNVTVNGLAIRMGYKQGACAPVYYDLNGTHEPTLGMINKILAVTGMTFEEAFARKEEPDAHT